MIDFHTRLLEIKAYAKNPIMKCVKLIKCLCCPHIETSQLIFTANQLAGFYMRATLTLNELIKNPLFWYVGMTSGW